MSFPDTETALLDAYKSFQRVLQQCALSNSQTSLPSELSGLMFPIFKPFCFFCYTLPRDDTQQQMSALSAKQDTIGLNIPLEVLRYVLLFQSFLS